MILTVYLAFVALAIVILAVGVVLGENYFSFVGLFFMFLLGLNLALNGVEYQIGEITQTNYTYSNGTVASTSAALTYAYTNLEDTLTHWFGYLIAIASAAGMAAVLTMANRDFKAANEYKRDYSE